ncbi:class I adenylate cyclase [Corallincola spongiicola]|uniref:Class I adenylate cyclase n=1 Tax=Corallincola spongiicola TaxID=2520508 RepID=A0ABY1WKX0_9GAMM|nr:class I adenylate cyclase [Corallincola spongiicola]
MQRSVDLQIAQLTRVKQRVVNYNQLRLSRAEAGLTTVGRRVFRLLPTLFHFNHPELPGFVSLDTPSGIANFEPSNQQLSLTEELIRNLGGAGIEQLPSPQQTDIIGLYCMGSTASIGQCSESDLDIWVCHHCHLAPAVLESLRLKCEQLTAWAATMGVEANFFLVNPEQFRSGHNQVLSEDNCGSAQHWLLLDEFYRSAVRIAGRHLVWSLIPADQEANYNEVVEGFYESGEVDKSEWLDMGGFSGVPAEEYFGATLWQLYKGIDSPYKAVIKTLLMEAYSHEYPHSKLLCVELKRILHEGCDDPLLLDPYYRMLLKVTDYLESQGDMQRLDLARRCFYLKTHEKLSSPDRHEGEWRRQAIRELVDSWGWDQEKLRHLDNRSHWKVEQVRVAYTELLDTQLLSFRKLIQFARDNDLSDAINPEDISILSRKLYSAFESLPSKINLINPQISPDLHEPEITLIEVPEGRKVDAGWYLYKRPLETSKLIGAKPQKHADSLLKVMSWAHFNGVMTNDSELYLYRQCSALDLRTLQQCSSDLRNCFPVRRPAVDKQALSRPSQIGQLAVFINLVADPTVRWRDRVIDFDVSSHDVLKFGPEQQCLVTSIDLLYLNSWNELHVTSFSGEQALLDGIKAITNKMSKHASPPTQIDLFCYSEQFSSQIRRRVQGLLQESIEHRLHRDCHRPHLMVVPIGRDKYGLTFSAKEVSSQQIDNSVDLYRHISKCKREHAAVQFDDSGELMVPKVVEANASEGLVQYFFEQLADQLNIYVVDENNRVEAYGDYNGSREDLVQSVNRFFTSSEQACSAEQVNFNLPQFYDIVSTGSDEVQVQPYRSCRQSVAAEPVPQAV